MQTVLYPIRRALPLVEAISFNDVLLWILTSHWPTYTSYPTFECLLAQTTVGLGGEGGVGLDGYEGGGYEVAQRKVDVLNVSVGQSFSFVSLAVSSSKG